MDPKRMDELMKELRRVVEAKPTRVVSTSVPGGSGYTALDNESIEEVDFWGDYDDLDDEQFFQAVERVEKQHAKEEAAAAAKLGKTAKLRVRDANVSSAASGLEGGPAAKRARVGGASNEAKSNEAEVNSEADAPEPASESETMKRHKRFFKPFVTGGEDVLKFGPNIGGLRGWFDVYVAGETQPRLVHGDVEAKLELREFTSLEPRHEHASYNARDSGKHEVRSVGVCGQRDDFAMKIHSKTFAWTDKSNVGRVANDDADVIVVPSKAVALDFLLQRKKHYSRELSGTDISVPDNFARCFITKFGSGAVAFTLRSKSSNQAKAACKRIAVNDSHWRGIQERAKTTIVYDKFAYASRPNPVRGPAVLTSGREAVEFAKRWIDERRREVSEYLKANVNTLKKKFIACSKCRPDSATSRKTDTGY